MRRRLVAWGPLALAILLGAALSYGLAKPDATSVTSKMIGASVPPFVLPPATPARPGLAAADLATGRPQLLNIFASWCVPCAAEAPQLRAIAAAGVPVSGIAIRDRPEDVTAFLNRHGNPFRRIGSDTASRVQMDLGSSGVPESFVIDGRGMIVQQTIGPIGARDVAAIVAAVKAAR